MRAAALALIGILTLAGCASHGHGVMPAASIGTPPGPDWQGVWRGTVFSREFANAAGPSDGAAVLTVGSDGRWTMVERHSGAVEQMAGTARVVGSRIILDGRIERGDGAGARVVHVLTRRGADELGGSLDAFNLGHRVSGALDLYRQAADHAPAPAATRD